MNNVYPTCRNLLKTTIALFGVFMLLYSPSSVNAQSTGKNESAKTGVSAQPGTYQLIFNNRREDKDIKLSQLELLTIEKLRKDTEVVYAAATYSDDIRVKILPRQVINAPGFSPAPLKYYKDEERYEEYSQIRYIPLQ